MTDIFTTAEKIRPVDRYEFSVPEVTEAVPPKLFPTRRKKIVKKIRDSVGNRLLKQLSSLEIGQMLKVKHPENKGNVLITHVVRVRKHLPDRKIVSRTLDKDTVGVYRVA